MQLGNVCMVRQIYSICREELITGARQAQTKAVSSFTGSC